MIPEENNDETVDPQSMYQDPSLQETRGSGEEIVGGARQEDQLDKFKESVTKGSHDNDAEQQSGAQPDAYQTPEEHSEDA